MCRQKHMPPHGNKHKSRTYRLYNSCGRESQGLWEQDETVNTTAAAPDTTGTKPSAASPSLSFYYVTGQTITLRDPLYSPACDSNSRDHVHTGPSHTDRRSSTSGLAHALLSGEYVIPHPSRPGYVLCGAIKDEEQEMLLPPMKARFSSDVHFANVLSTLSLDMLLQR